MFDFTDLAWADHAENMGGFNSSAFLGISTDIDTYAELPAVPAAEADYVTLEGVYVMKPTKKFIEVHVTPDTAKAIAENQGETDGQSFKLKGEFLYPGTKAECRAFARKINNARGVIILEDAEGERLVVGTKARPCYFKPTLDWGQKAADRKGMTVAFESDSFVPGYLHDGAIPLTPAV